MKNTATLLGIPPSFRLPPYLEGLERILFPPYPERPPLGFPFPVFPVLAALLLERNESDVLRRQCLFSVFRKQVVWHVLEMGLLSCCPTQLSVVT